MPGEQLHVARNGQKALEEKVGAVLHRLEETKQEANRHANHARNAQWQVHETLLSSSILSCFVIVMVTYAHMCIYVLESRQKRHIVVLLLATSREGTNALVHTHVYQ